MAQGSHTLVDLKMKLDKLSEQIFDIDLQIQKFKQQRNLQHIPNLEAAKVTIQNDIVDLQIQFELKKAQNKKNRQ